ncbi:MAG: hypothetical protein ACC645_16025 [Pirellulales bacterium]
MRRITSMNIGLISLCLSLWALWGFGNTTVVLGQAEADTDFRDEFFRLCDIATEELNKDFSPFGERDNADPKTHHVPFFEDGSAIRALAVGYELTDKKDYLEACKYWCDRMIAYQEQMIPKGAYYLNYAGTRGPGEKEGMWYISDAGTVGMAVLATAVRCEDQAAKQRYINSVTSFAKVVMADRIGKGGGIIEHLWGNFKEEWWCSTATFGSLAFHLYDETGDEQYLKVGLDALRWMIGRDFRQAKVIGFDQRPSGVVFYDFQLYVAGLKHLPEDSKERQSATMQISKAIQWMAENQRGRGRNPPWSYRDDGHTDMAALPFLMYAFADQLPEHQDLNPAADRELRYVAGLIFESGDPAVSRLKVWELVSWGMLSYAEKLSPGSLFRASKQQP